MSLGASEISSSMKHTFPLLYSFRYSGLQVMRFECFIYESNVTLDQFSYTFGGLNAGGKDNTAYYSL